MFSRRNMMVSRTIVSRDLTLFLLLSTTALAGCGGGGGGGGGASSLVTSASPPLPRKPDSTADTEKQKEPDSTADSAALPSGAETESRPSKSVSEPLRQSSLLQYSAQDETSPAIRITNIHPPLHEDSIVSSTTRLATIQVDDPDRNSNFRNWLFTLSEAHSKILAVYEVGGSLGLYFRQDMKPDYEMEAGWTIPIGIFGTNISADVSITVINHDEAPTAIRVTNIHKSLYENKIVSSTTRLAKIQVDDPDSNPDFRNWQFTLLQEPPDAPLVVRKVDGSLGLYFQRDITPDFEMPTDWSISIGIVNMDLSVSMTIPIKDQDDDPTDISVTNIHPYLNENKIVSHTTRLANIQVDDPDSNPDFRNWRFTLSEAHSKILEVREVGGSLGLYFRQDMAPDYEMPAGWTIPIGIVGTDLSESVSILIINQDDPTTMSIAVRGVPHIGNSLTVDISDLNDPDGTPDVEVEWYRVESDRTLSGILSGGKYFTPREAGEYRVEVKAFSPDFTTKTTHTFTAQVTVTAPPVPTAAVLDEDIQIYENHPNDKPIYDALGDGDFTLNADYGDNAMFRVTDDGRIMFAPTTAHSRLDHENPADSDGNNIYNLQLIRTLDGQTQTINLTLTVQDLPYEQLYFARDEDAFFQPFYRLRPEHLSDGNQPSVEIAQMILGTLWHMPKSGPLLLTYSIMMPKKVGLSVGRKVGYLTSEERIAKMRQDIRLAFDEFERAANVKFIEVDESQDIRGDIRFYPFDGTIGDARSTGPSVSGVGELGRKAGSVIEFETDLTNDPAYYYSIIVHEIGHTLGLGHPFHNSDQGWLGDETLRENSGTIMSYSRSKQSYIDGALTLWDIKVLQFLYGKPGTNFDGVESRLLKSYQVFHVTPDRNALFMDEARDDNITAESQRLATFTLVGDNRQAINFGSQQLIITSPNTDMFELRQNADGSISLWLRDGQHFDFETIDNDGVILVRIGLESPQNKILLKPLYFQLKIRDVDEKPSAMDITANRLATELPENQPITEQKLADISFTGDTIGTNRPLLIENPYNLFELRQDGDTWSLWLSANDAAPDFETLQKPGETRTTTIEAVVGSVSSGIGDEPNQQRYKVTIRNIAEFDRKNHAEIIGPLHAGQELRADTSGITSEDGVLTFSYVWKSGHDWRYGDPLSTDETFVPELAGNYILIITAQFSDFSSTSDFLRIYEKKFFVDLAIQSAGSQGMTAQRSVDDGFDDGLSHPIQDDLPPQNADMI